MDEKLLKELITWFQEFIVPPPVPMKELKQWQGDCYTHAVDLYLKLRIEERSIK